MKGRYKDWKFQQQIQNNLILQNHEENLPAHCVPSLKYNNVKYNVTILKERDVIIHLCIIFGIGFYSLVHLYVDFDDEMAHYRWLCYRELFVITIFFKMMVPLKYLLTRQDLRNFIKMTMMTHLATEDVKRKRKKATWLREAI